MRVFLPRWAVVLGLAGLCAHATAQTAPLDSTRTAQGDSVISLEWLEILGSDEETPDLADELVRTLGRRWEDVRSALPPADSSSVTGELGDVWWSALGVTVDGFRAFIQNGRVESVTLDFSSDGPDLAAYARRLYDRLGSPRADGFYATDQTGYPFSLALDPAANRLTARAVPGQLVGER